MDNRMRWRFDISRKVPGVIKSPPPVTCYYNGTVLEALAELAVRANAIVNPGRFDSISLNEEDAPTTGKDKIFLAYLSAEEGWMLLT